VSFLCLGLAFCAFFWFSLDYFVLVTLVLVCLSVCLSVCLCVCVVGPWFVGEVLAGHIGACMCVCMCVCLSVCLSVCLCLSVW